ncbi:MAG: DEAD/DEAH box helicase [Oceanospirillaceae bacterium]|nr:DEAD/DEAH box helicase [Oceanospirillaceae bacterium]
MTTTTSAAPTPAAAIKFAEQGYNPRLLINLKQQGFEHATQAQTHALPVALAGQDLLMSADTGSGKTLAYVIPALNQILNTKAVGFSTRCLILVPTRELAHQVLSLTNKLIKGTKLQAALILGGEDYHYQQALLRKNPDLVVATPGRFMEHQRKNQTDTENLELLIIDEADRMLELGFCEDVEAIAAACNKNRQTLFYSATLHSPKVQEMAQQLLKNPVDIRLNDASQVQDNIKQMVVVCDQIEHKQRVLAWLLAHEPAKKRLIFCNSRKLSEQLATFLQGHSVDAVALHGELPQDMRNDITRQYRQHSFNTLVATEVAARGLDIDGVELVINFDMARNLDDYLHRTGRTGRAGSQGKAINLVNITERGLLLSVEKAQGAALERMVIKGHEAKEHRDAVSSAKSNPKTTAKKPAAISKKEAAKQRQAQTNAASIWGDGTMPFGKKKP